jgi:hypothetical protein
MHGPVPVTTSSPEPSPGPTGSARWTVEPQSRSAHVPRSTSLGLSCSTRRREPDDSPRQPPGASQCSGRDPIGRQGSSSLPGARSLDFRPAVRRRTGAATGPVPSHVRLLQLEAPLNVTISIHSGVGSAFCPGGRTRRSNPAHHSFAIPPQSHYSVQSD